MSVAITRSRVITAVLSAGLIALAVWIASHTYWGERKVPVPLRGEAAVNPFYAAQHFAEELGARTRRETTVGDLPDGGVVFLTSWDWNLNTERRERLERWVENGGRLVVDSSLLDGGKRFQDWSLVSRLDMVSRPGAPPLVLQRALGKLCLDLEEERENGGNADRGDAAAARGGSPRTLSICGLTPGFLLYTDRRVRWALRDEMRLHAVRVGVRNGTVTVINATPFRERDLLDRDAGALFVAATQVHSGDDVVFLSEADVHSLLALLWRYGAPVVVLLAAFIALALWRGAVRFGPLAAPVDGARRSLAEQIRGTGQFALRFGGGEALHGAAVRALTEVASRRIAGYARLPRLERIAAVAKLTGADKDSLAAAFTYSGAHRTQELRGAIAQLEGARRRILAKTAGSKHGTRTEH